MTSRSRHSYDYRHIVTFEETSLLGTAYFVNHLRWQGRCRELFLRQNAPELAREFEGGLCLVTTHCACEYLVEIFALDEVIVRMSLSDMMQNRFTLSFEYLKIREQSEVVVARGTQQVACMRREGSRLLPEPIPACLQKALEPYSAGLLSYCFGAPHQTRE